MPQYQLVFLREAFFNHLGGVDYISVEEPPERVRKFNLFIENDVEARKTVKELQMQLNEQINPSGDTVYYYEKPQICRIL